jgi:hypothetical protein
VVASCGVVPLEGTLGLFLFEAFPENVFHDFGVGLAEGAAEVTGLGVLLLDGLLVFEELLAGGGCVAESVLHGGQEVVIIICV